VSRLTENIGLYPVTEKKLSDLVNMDSPDAVMEEVGIILSLVSPTGDPRAVKDAFATSVCLFNGDYPGYRACNTDYHDFRHTTDTFLAMARLIHGAVLAGKTFADRDLALGLIAILFHDTGYIQKKHDNRGTGAKYTVRHVQRSMDFLERHGPEHGLTPKEIAVCKNMILCTDLSVEIDEILFQRPGVELLGKMVGTADLVAQMADRTYLEKLLFLYREFEEGNVDGFENEIDLLHKTVGFYDFIDLRLATKLGDTEQFMEAHFIERWDIHADLYRTAIENQKIYLQDILEKAGKDPFEYMRRDGIVDAARTENNGHENNT